MNKNKIWVGVGSPRIHEISYVICGYDISTYTNRRTSHSQAENGIDQGKKLGAYKFLTLTVLTSTCCCRGQSLYTPGPVLPATKRTVLLLCSCTTCDWD